MNGKNIQRTYLIGGLGALVVAVGIGVAVLMNQPVPPAAPAVVAEKKVPQSSVISYEGKKGQTALAQLKKATGGVVTKASSYGEYVDTIGDLKGGKDGKYWTFYVDGKMASVGAGSYVSKGGEKIQWKFEKAQ